MLNGELPSIINDIKSLRFPKNFKTQCREIVEEKILWLIFRDWSRDGFLTNEDFFFLNKHEIEIRCQREKDARDFKVFDEGLKIGSFFVTFRSQIKAKKSQNMKKRYHEYFEDFLTDYKNTLSFFFDKN